MTRKKCLILFTFLLVKTKGILRKEKTIRNIENFIFNPNLEKIQREMKFTTKTSLIDGIQKTIKWIKSV